MCFDLIFLPLRNLIFLVFHFLFVTLLPFSSLVAFIARAIDNLTDIILLVQRQFLRSDNTDVHKTFYKNVLVSLNIESEFYSVSHNPQCNFDMICNQFSNL